MHKATTDLVRLELENMIREKDKLRQVKEQRARATSFESNDSKNVIARNSDEEIEATKAPEPLNEEEQEEKEMQDKLSSMFAKIKSEPDVPPKNLKKHNRQKS